MPNQPNKRSRKRSPEAIQFARNQRATANEFAQAVWQMVRDRRCRDQKFRREYPVPPYTVDFCCVALRLVIEVDGEHHFTDEGKRHDEQRDGFLVSQGYRVLRIPGYDVIRDPGSVLKQIETAIDERNRELAALPRFEIIDDQMASVLRQKTDSQRLRSVDAFWKSARAIVKAAICTEHPDWDAETINAEIARRISNGAFDDSRA